MRAKVVKLAKILGIYQVYAALWRRTVGAYRSKHDLDWVERDSERLLKNRVAEVGDSILQKSAGKKIVFIGYNAFADYMRTFLESHGRSIYKYFVDEQEHFLDEGGDFYSLDNILCEEIHTIYALVITRIDPFRKVSLLLDYGFSLEQIWTLDLDKERGTKGKECYDVLLGYTREDDGQGFTIFGNRDSKYKIMTLGGSTTDATCSGLRSWSELLYNKIKDRYPDVSVWCGGMGSFVSSTELFKLIRDGICSSPTMVISYSGFNDIYDSYISYMAANDKTVYKYQIEFLEKALQDGIINSYNPKIKVKKVTSGDNSNWDIARQWIENERMMKAVCETNNIVFRSYFQPCRIYEEVIKGGPVNAVYMEYYERLKQEHNAIEDIHTFFSKWYNIVIEKLKEEKNWFITDLSGIFLHENNIYTDECHVYEKGNRIICNRIYKDIVTDLDQWSGGEDR